jgi:hypothetical protein
MSDIGDFKVCKVWTIPPGTSAADIKKAKAKAKANAKDFPCPHSESSRGAVSADSLKSVTEGRHPTKGTLAGLTRKSDPKTGKTIFREVDTSHLEATDGRIKQGATVIDLTALTKMNPKKK